MPPVTTIFADTVGVPGDNGGVLPLPILNGAFSLPSLSITSFFGGDSTFMAASAVALMPGRRWLGWYNSPGTPALAGQFIELAHLKIVSSLFRSGERDPTSVFKLHGKTGKKYVAAHSCVVLDFTGHPASLLTSKAEETPLSHAFDKGKHGKGGTGQNVTIINLQQHVVNNLTMPLSFSPPPLSTETLWSLAPMAVSVGASIMCALVADWFCFASIVVGMVAHGSVCAIIGSGKLTFTAPEADKGAPPGDGVLASESEAVILVGAGAATNVFTRGRFFLKYRVDKGEGSGAPTGEEADETGNTKAGREGDREKHTKEAYPTKKTVDGRKEGIDPTSSSPAPPAHAPTLAVPTFWRRLVDKAKDWWEYVIWSFALLLMVQPLVQLFLIPFGTLFGQFMFVASILASWAYNIYISYRIDRDALLTRFLFDKLGLDDSRHIQKYRLTTVTSAVAFIAFVLASARPKFMDPLPFLDAMLPQNAVVWKAWKEAMASVLKDREYINQGSADGPIFSDADLKRVDRQYQGLLDIFFHDANDAWKAWCKVRDEGTMVDLREVKCEIAK